MASDSPKGSKLDNIILYWVSYCPFLALPTLKSVCWSGSWYTDPLAASTLTVSSSLSWYTRNKWGPSKTSILCQWLVWPNIRKHNAKRSSVKSSSVSVCPVSFCKIVYRLATHSRTRSMQWLCSERMCISQMVISHPGLNPCQLLWGSIAWSTVACMRIFCKCPKMTGMSSALSTCISPILISLSILVRIPYFAFYAKIWAKAQ